jgi:hypothetical protein
VTTLDALSPAVAALITVLSTLSPDAAALVASAEVSPAAAALIADITQRWSRDSRFSVTRKETQQMLGIGATREIDLERAGELNSYLEGSMRRVPVGPIYARLIKLAIASHPVDGTAAKVRRPAKRFTRKIRPRTEAELRGLALGNERRRLEAQARKAKTAQRS